MIEQLSDAQDPVEHCEADRSRVATDTVARAAVRCNHEQDHWRGEAGNILQQRKGAPVLQNFKLFEIWRDLSEDIIRRCASEGSGCRYCCAHSSHRWWCNGWSAPVDWMHLHFLVHRTKPPEGNGRSCTCARLPDTKILPVSILCARH